MATRLALLLIALVVLALLLGFIASEVEVRDDGTIFIFGSQVVCRAGYPCEDAAGTDIQTEYPDDRD